jgi:hypothetical protein
MFRLSKRKIIEVTLRKMFLKIYTTQNLVILVIFLSKKFNLHLRPNAKSIINNPHYIRMLLCNDKTQKEHFHLPISYKARILIATVKGNSMCNLKEYKIDNPAFQS